MLSIYVLRVKSLSYVRLFSEPHGLQPARLLCPWNSPGNITGVGCPFLLQGIFSTQGSNLGLPHCRQSFYYLNFLYIFQINVGSWLWERGIFIPVLCRFSSVQSCPTLCDPMDCSTPGLPVHHQLPELAQTPVHRVGDAIQSSQPLLSPSPPAFSLPQHQVLFQWVRSLHQVAKVLELRHQSD